MELNEAIVQARVILDQEEIKPTLNYRYVSKEWPTEIWHRSELKTQGYSAAMAGAIALMERRRYPTRDVTEKPDQWQFESVNYELLLALFQQLSIANRQLFLGGLLNLTRSRQTSSRTEAKSFHPSWNGYTSGLPLMVEMCIRNGYLSIFFGVLNNVEMPNANLIVMMVQLQETLSLNYNIFSKTDLEGMPAALKHLRNIADRQTWEQRRPRGTTGLVEKNEHFRRGFSAEGAELVRQIDSFLKLCAKAVYFYVKNNLEQMRNPEIEADKKAVETHLVKLGFSQTMVNSLNEAERLFRNTSNPFELKSCLGHLRSFLEELHLQACPSIALPNETIPQKWGGATTFLRTHDIINQKEEVFITALYTLVSDEAIHPLIAEAEYARLFRNIVIEYGLLFLVAFEKKGIGLRSTP
jgi:hypothetical protein